MPRRHVLVVRLLFVASVVGITYLALTGARYPLVAELNDKLKHAAAFYTLALLLDCSFPERPFGVSKIGALLAYGVFLELLQSATPARDPSLWDMGADTAGMLAYVLSTPLLRRVPFLAWRWDARRFATSRR